jgi:hypothetical protein
MSVDQSINNYTKKDTTTMTTFSSNTQNLMSHLLGIDLEVNQEVEKSNSQVVSSNSQQSAVPIVTGRKTVATQKTEPDQRVIKVATPIKVISSRAAIKQFDLDSQFSTNGYVCLNDNTVHFDASVIWELTRQFPAILDQLDQAGYTASKMIRVEFGLSKELVTPKTVTKKGRNLIPDQIDHGKTIERTIRVQNQGRVNTGLPSTEEYGWKSSSKMGILDHKNVIKLIVGNVQVFPVVGTGTHTILKSQATHAITGVSREHRDTSGYIGRQTTKSKRSTGIKLASSIQKGIDTSLISSRFDLPGYQYSCQLRVLATGAISLQMYAPQGLVALGVIANIIGSHSQECCTPQGVKSIKIFDWSYVESFKGQSEKLTKQIVRFTSQVNRDLTYFLASNKSLGLTLDGKIRPVELTDTQQKSKDLIKKVGYYNPRRK